MVVLPAADWVGLSAVVAPDLHIRRTPPSLVVLLQETPDGLLRGDAPEQPFRATARRTRKIKEVAPFGLVQNHMRQRLEPDLLVALEQFVGNIRDHRRGDARRRRTEKLDRKRPRQIGRHGREQQLAVFIRHALGQFLVAAQFQHQFTIAVGNEHVHNQRVRRHAGVAQIAMQMRSLHRLIVQHNLPHAEREGKGARETFVAAPEREAVRHRGEQLRIERPDRHLRVCDRVGAGRYLDLVVEPHLAPAVGRADPPQPRPGEESVRIDVAGRPVNVAWLVERRRDEGNRRIGLRRKQERALLHRPGPGGIWSVFTQLHANGNARRIVARHALGANEETKSSALERHPTATLQLLGSHHAPVGHQRLGHLRHDLCARDRMEQHEAMQAALIA